MHERDTLESLIRTLLVWGWKEGLGVGGKALNQGGHLHSREQHDQRYVFE